MPPPMDRRQFLRRAGAGAAAVGALPFSLPAARPLPPSERIGIGIIGVGSLGRNHHLPILLRMADFDVMAFADPDRDHLDQAVQRTDGKAVAYRDYRELLDRADVDAVLIATPDHWHALAVAHACQAGKDVYCEKPLSLTVVEGQAMVAAARRYGRVVQTGTQQRSSSRFRWACELVRNGRIGKLERVDVVLGSGPTAKWRPDAEPPQNLDWDLWLGPSPAVPYNPARCHYTFRWFYDYSGGKMTDWGAHHLDIVQWALGTELSGPRAVVATGTFPADNFYETAVEFDVVYTYDDGLPVHVRGSGKNGVTFTGSEGTVFVSRSEIKADPPAILETPVGAGPIVLEESTNHHRNWVECVRERRRPISDVEVGHRSASVCHLGNIAMHLGRSLRWDPASERFLGDEAANRLLHRPMRGDWSL